MWRVRRKGWSETTMMAGLLKLCQRTRAGTRMWVTPARSWGQHDTGV